MPARSHLQNNLFTRAMLALLYMFVGSTLSAICMSFVDARNATCEVVRPERARVAERGPSSHQETHTAPDKEDKR